MEQYERQLLEALRAFLRSEPARVLLTEQADWAQLWELAAQQKPLLSWRRRLLRRKNWRRLTQSK